MRKESTVLLAAGLGLVLMLTYITMKKIRKQKIVSIENDEWDIPNNETEIEQDGVEYYYLK